MSTSLRRHVSALSVSALALAVGVTTALTGLTASAEPGDVDPGFGSQSGWANPPGGSGIQPAFGNVSTVRSAADEWWTVGVRGDGTQRILQVLRHTNTGADPAAGAARVVHELGYLGSESAAVSDGAGGAFVAMTTPVGLEWAPVVVHLLADRTIDPAWGRVVLPSAPSVIEFIDVERNAATGALTVVVQHSDILATAVTAIRVTGAGALDPTFGNGGVGATQQLGDTEANPVSTALAADGSVYVTGSTFDRLRIRKWTNAGGVDGGYGSGGAQDYLPAGSTGVVASPGATVDPLGRLLVPYQGYGGAGPRGRVARLSPAGAPEGGYSGAYDDASWTSVRPVALSVNADSTVQTAWFVTTATDTFTVRVTFGATGAWSSTSWNYVCDATPHTGLITSTSWQTASNNSVAETWCTSSAPSLATRSNAASKLPVGHSALQVSESGRIFATPEIYSSDDTTDIGVLLPSGQPASDVGVGGFVGTAFGSGAGLSAQNVSLGPGDTFFVRHRAEIGRFTAAGALDPGFSGDGRVQPPALTTAFAVMALRDGGAMMAGHGGGPVRMVRLLPNGDQDPGFGVGGVSEMVVAAGSGTPVGQAADGGTIWALGGSVDKVIRVLPGGGQDMAFGTGGQITLSSSGAALDRQGRILVATNGDGMVRVRRFTPTGQPDTGFGSGGVVEVTPPAGLAQNASGLTAWPDGSMVVGLQRYPASGGTVRLAWAILDGAGQVRATRSTGLSHSYSPGVAMTDGRVATLESSDAPGSGMSRVFVFKGLPPTTPTLTAVATGPTTATLTATGSGAGLPGVTLGSDVGPTTGYGSRDLRPVPAVLGDHIAVRDLTGLAPATTYHARAVLTNASGTTEGVDVTFTTPAPGAPVAAPPLSRNPTVSITLPRKSKRATIRAWKVLKGTAAPAAATPAVKIAKVRINLVRTVSRKKCAFYTGKAWRTTTCKKAARKWVSASGTTAWKLKVKGLRLGSYTVRAKVRDAAGAQSVAVAGVNRFRFKLKRA